MRFGTVTTPTLRGPSARLCASTLCVGWGLIASAAWAQEDAASVQPAMPVAAPALGEPAAASDPSRPAAPVFQGALGPVVSWSRQGRTLETKPGFYLRYKRFSLSNTSSFAVRRNDDVFRGLGLDVVNDDHLQFNLGLRYDRGGRVSDLPALAGQDRVRSTVRLRASVTYRLTPRWSLGSGWSADVLGRGGGQLFDLGLSREEDLGHGLHWAAGAGLSAADSRFQRSYFGVNASQSAASGLPTYSPSSGLLNATLGTSLRKEISPRWVGFVGLSAVQRLGPQVNSPLTSWSTNWGVSAGIARRF